MKLQKVAKQNVTVTILLIVIACVIAYYLFGTEVAYKRTTNARQQIDDIKSALERYKHDYGHYPSEVEGLPVLMEDGVNGRYFVDDKYLTDPWHNPVKYTLESSISKVKVILYSSGPNGIDEHTAGDDISITWNSRKKPGHT